MIRPLRQRHRVIICALGVVLPVAFVAGIGARKPVPAMAALPLEVVAHASHFESVVWERNDLWTNQPIRTRFVADQSGHLGVELSAANEIVRPDLIVYWASGDQNFVDRLPDDAVLLGRFTPQTTLPLPDKVRTQKSALVLYSLADHELVAVSKPFTSQRN